MKKLTSFYCAMQITLTIISKLIQLLAVFGLPKTLRCLKFVF